MNDLPVADANGPYSGDVGQSISFSSAGSDDPDGSIVSYHWDFGDGSQTVLANPSHDYSNEGEYTATLTVTDDDGETDTDTASVTISLEVLDLVIELVSPADGTTYSIDSLFFDFIARVSRGGLPLEGVYVEWTYHPGDHLTLLGTSYTDADGYATVPWLNRNLWNYQPEFDGSVRWKAKAVKDGETANSTERIFYIIPDATSIVSFEPPSGTYEPGDSTSAVVRIENTGTTTQSFWVGLSWWDSEETRYDVPPVESDVLSPGGADNVIFNFTIPNDVAQGNCDISTEVWEDYDGVDMLPPKFDEEDQLGAFTIEWISILAVELVSPADGVVVDSLSFELVARVTQNGVPVEGASVAFLYHPGNQWYSADGDETDSEGYARVNWNNRNPYNYVSGFSGTVRWKAWVSPDGSIPWATLLYREDIATSTEEYTFQIIFYDADVGAYCEAHGADSNVDFLYDDSSYTTSQTFNDQLGSHIALAPENDGDSGHVFKEWRKDGVFFDNSRSIAITEAGTYTIRFHEAPEDAASIVSFEPPSGTFNPGDSTSATVRIRNTGTTTRSFYVGLSWWDSEGTQYDVTPVESDVLSPGGADNVIFNFTIPNDVAQGNCDISTEVWEDYDGVDMLPPKFDEEDQLGAFTIEWISILAVELVSPADGVVVDSLSFELVARVTQNGVPVEGASVAFLYHPGNQWYSADGDETDSEGYARVNWNNRNPYNYVSGFSGTVRWKAWVSPDGSIPWATLLYREDIATSTEEYTFQIIFYDADVGAYCEAHGADSNVDFLYDDSSYTTSQTFNDQLGSHIALAPENDGDSGHVFKEWRKDGVFFDNSRSIAITEAGTYTIRFHEAPEDAASIVSFEPPSGTFNPGDSTSATVRIRNTGTTTRSFYVGLSWWDSEGTQYDVTPVESDVLSPGGEDNVGFVSFTIPNDAAFGDCNISTAIWEDYDDTDMVPPEYDEETRSGAFTINTPVWLWMTVETTTGDPIEGASIEWDGLSIGETGSDGRIRVDTEFPPSTHSWEASKEGYTSLSGYVEIGSDSSGGFTVTLSESTSGLDFDIELLTSSQSEWTVGDQVVRARINNIGTVTIPAGDVDAIFWVYDPSDGKIIDGFDSNSRSIAPGEVYVFESTWDSSGGAVGWYDIEVLVSASVGGTVVEKTDRTNNAFELLEKEQGSLLIELQTPTDGMNFVYPPVSLKVLVTLEGEIVQGATVNFYLGGSINGTETTDDQGIASLEVFPLDGLHRWYATVEKTGAKSDTSVVRSFSIGSITQTSGKVTLLSSFRPRDLANLTTNSVFFEVCVSSTSAGIWRANVAFFVDGELVETVQTDMYGFAKINRTLSRGSHYWYVTAWKANYNTASSPLMKFNVLKPIADISSSHIGAYIGENITFDASGSQFEGGVITSYQFDFGDGSELTWTTEPIIMHSYNTTGVYSVRCKVKGSFGLTSDWSDALSIEVRELSATILNKWSETDALSLLERSTYELSGAIDSIVEVYLPFEVADVSLLLEGPIIIEGQRNPGEQSYLHEGVLDENHYEFRLVSEVFDSTLTSHLPNYLLTRPSVHGNISSLNSDLSRALSVFSFSESSAQLVEDVINVEASIVGIELSRFNALVTRPFQAELESIKSVIDLHISEWSTSLKEYISVSKTLLTELGSPADILLTDENGGMVGAYYEGGIYQNDINTIPSAFYSGSDSTHPVIVLFNSSGEYTIQLIGKSTGEYTLDVNSLSQYENHAVNIAGVIAKDERRNIVLQINETGPVNYATEAQWVNIPEECVHGDKVDLEIKITDLNGVESVEARIVDSKDYTINGEMQENNGQYTFTINTEECSAGVANISIIVLDRFGNLYDLNSILKILGRIELSGQILNSDVIAGGLSTIEVYAMDQEGDPVESADINISINETPIEVTYTGDGNYSSLLNTSGLEGNYLIKASMSKENYAKASITMMLNVQAPESPNGPINGPLPPDPPILPPWWPIPVVLGAGVIIIMLMMKRNPDKGKTIPPRINSGDIVVPPEGYSDLDLIGKGGFSTVWRARRELDGLQVALKLPKVEGYTTIDRRVSDGFMKEAELWSSLKANSIVKVFDYGSKPLPWIAMELMDGGTLRQIMKGKPLPMRQVIDIGCRILDALTEAHTKGVIHGDLKPENVLFTKDGDVKVADWGLARVLFEVSSKSSAGWKGTLAYSAPEQFNRKKYGDPDHRTDFYQLGVLLYEMATGKLPFEGRAREEVMFLILEDTPDPPSMWVPELLAEFDEIIMRALAKQKEDRYSFTYDFKRELLQVGKSFERSE